MAARHILSWPRLIGLGVVVALAGLAGKAFFFDSSEPRCVGSAQATPFRVAAPKELATGELLTLLEDPRVEEALWSEAVRRVSVSSETMRLIAIAESKCDGPSIRCLEGIAADGTRAISDRILACESLGRCAVVGPYPGLLAINAGHPELLLSLAEALVRVGQQREGFIRLFRAARSPALRLSVNQRLRRLTGDRFLIPEQADIATMSRIVDSWDARLDELATFTPEALPRLNRSRKTNQS